MQLHKNIREIIYQNTLYMLKSNSKQNIFKKKNPTIHNRALMSIYRLSWSKVVP